MLAKFKDISTCTTPQVVSYRTNMQFDTKERCILYLILHRKL